jgi:predicted acylesterase/phospholipase RssA
VAPSKELRFAVVFNGGVSLAVWMGGVTHELNLMRLASAGVEGGQDAAALTAWRAILHECKRTVVVDLIAGTSAGGLNGALLAAAVAGGSDLSSMRTTWLHLPSLDTHKLTRDYKNPRPGEESAPTSVLSGEYFTDSIRNTFEDIARSHGGGDSQPPAQDCTLLVTATALKSAPTRLALAGGDAVQTVDGRRVYRFERRGNDWNDFSGRKAALSLAARASASFPGAFAPVPETEELASCRNDPQNTSPPTWLADGGILDNAPFEPILETLLDRPMDEPFERSVLYVTPGVSAPSGVDASEKDGRPPTAPKLPKVLGWVASAMREPDQRLDRDALERAFDLMNIAQSQPFVVLRDYLQSPTTFLAENRDPLHTAAAAIFSRYRSNRALALRDWLTKNSGLEMSPLTLRWSVGATVADDDLATLLPSSADALEYDAARQWNWGVSTADRVLRWWGRAMNLLPNAADGNAVGDAMESTNRERQWTSDRWDQLAACVRGSDSPMPPDLQVAAMKRFYFDETPSLNALLSGSIRSAAQAISDAVPGVSPRDLINLSLDIEVVSKAFDWGADEFDAPVFTYTNLTPANTPPTPAERTGGRDGLGQPLIDLGDLDPAENSDWPSRKLYGERWGHFGAFSGPDQRRHDWLWGRIDGADQLSRQLLSTANVDAETCRKLRERLKDAILVAEGVSEETVIAQAKIAYEMTPLELAKKMIEAPTGPPTVQNLVQTVLLMTQPQKSVRRLLWACLTPIYPSNEVKAWSPLLRGAAPVMWTASYPARALVFWYGRRQVRKAAARSINIRQDEVGAQAEGRPARRVSP